MDEFAAAQLKDIEYLLSEEFSEREDAQDTVPAVPLLNKIIQAGLITIDSQQGSCKTGVYEGDHYMIRERAYLQGFIRKSQSNKFINLMNTETDKIAFVVYREPSQEYFDIFYKTSLPTPNIVVTAEKGGSSVEEMLSKQLHHATSHPLVLPAKSVEYDQEKAGLKNVDVDLIVIIDPTYCRPAPESLYPDVLSRLLRSHS